MVLTAYSAPAPAVSSPRSARVVKDEARQVARQQVGRGGPPVQVLPVVRRERARGRIDARGTLAKAHVVARDRGHPPPRSGRGAGRLPPLPGPRHGRWRVQPRQGAQRSWGRRAQLPAAPRGQSASPSQASMTREVAPASSPAEARGARDVPGHQRQLPRGRRGSTPWHVPRMASKRPATRGRRTPRRIGRQGSVAPPGPRRRRHRPRRPSQPVVEHAGCVGHGWLLGAQAHGPLQEPATTSAGGRPSSMPARATPSQLCGRSSRGRGLAEESLRGRPVSLLGSPPAPA